MSGIANRWNNTYNPRHLDTPARRHAINSKHGFPLFFLAYLLLRENIAQTQNEPIDAAIDAARKLRFRSRRL